MKDNLISRVSEFVFYALALDESTDMAETAQLAIFIRGVDVHFKKTEELAAFYPLKDTTKSRDFLEKVPSTMNLFSL
ncbi:unnamed protein product, partial [Lymnaea stagnalis]